MTRRELAGIVDFLFLFGRPTAGDRLAGKMNNRIETFEYPDRIRVGLADEIELPDVNGGWERRGVRVANDRAYRIAPSGQCCDEGPANEPRCSGNADPLHGVILIGRYTEVRGVNGPKGPVLLKPRRSMYLENTQ